MVSTFVGVPHYDLLILTLLPKGKEVFLKHVTLKKVKKKNNPQRTNSFIFPNISSP